MRLSGAAAGGALFFRNVIGQQLGDFFIKQFPNIPKDIAKLSENPVLFSSVIRAFQLTLKQGARMKGEEYGVFLDDNSDHRSMLDIIKEAVSEYQRRGGRITFSFDKERKTDEDYEEIFYDWAGCISTEDIVALLRGELDGFAKFGRVKGELEKLERGKLWSAIANINDFSLRSHFNYSSFEARLLQAEALIHRQGIRSYADERVNSSHGLTGRSHNRDYELLARNIVLPIINEVSHECRERARGGKVSSSMVVEIFLRRAQGDLAKALFDTTIYFKLLARNDLSTGRLIGKNGDSWDQEHIDRFSHIKDEFSVIGSNFGIDASEQLGLGIDPVEKDVSPVNLIGQPYHNFNIVALLSLVPVGFIQRATLATQLMELERGKDIDPYKPAKNQGYVKTLSDLETLLELQDIEDYFRTLS